MTEAEWLECTDPEKMLAFLESKTYHRKLSLFAIACCRRVWHFLPEQRRREEMIEATEQFLDGEVSAWAAIEARYGPEDGWDWHMDCHRIGDPAGSAVEAAHASNYQVWRLVQDTANAAAQVIGKAAEDAVPRARNAVRLTGPALLQAAEAVRAVGRAANSVEKEAQCAILCDLIGSLPFRQFSIAPSWVTPAVETLAQQMYDSRNFSPMTRMADSLEEAGCTSEELLRHCRQTDEHVRGCWVVDLILDKK